MERLVVQFMHYQCSVYGLGIAANRTIPGVPESSISAIDLRVLFGVMPPWYDELPTYQIETSYISEFKDESGKPGLTVFRVLGGEYFRFCYADKTEFLTNQSGTEIWAVWPETLTLEDTATYLLGPVLGFVLLLRGVVCLHASAIAVGDDAIALLGPAGAGKSTTAAAFSARDHSILAEDVVTLDDRGNHFLVRPAYPCIRLWPASVEALFGNETHLPRMTPNWDKRYLDLTLDPKQFQTKPLRLAAIYLLMERRDDPLAPYVQSLTRPERLISLIANTYATNLMDKEMRGREFELLGRVLAHVPMRRVVPHASPIRIPELCECILSDFESLKRSCSDVDHPRSSIHV